MRGKTTVTRRWHSSALLLCVKSEETIGDPSAKTRQRHKRLLAGNRCLRESWHSPTILLLTGLNKRNTRDAVWLSPDERETLKHTGGLASKHFWFYTPKASDCAGDASVCGPGVKTRRVRRHGPAYSSKWSWGKPGWGVGNTEGKKKDNSQLRDLHLKPHAPPTFCTCSDIYTSKHSDTGCWQAVQ